MEEGKVLSDSVKNSDNLLLFQQIHNEALQKNEEIRKHWAKLKEDYESLEHHLSVLPKDLTKDVMVPIGPKALMKGKMIHTNEILVCLGDGWFVKRSAAQAAEICKRRLALCSDTLVALEKEQHLLSSRRELPLEQEAFVDRDEIMEPFDEEREAQWKIEHRQKEREYRKKLAELHNKEKTAIDSEETLWKRLEELELQEELEDELDRLHQDDDEEDDNEGDSGLSGEEDTLEDEMVVNTFLSAGDIRGGNGLIRRKVIIEETPESTQARPSTSARGVSFTNMQPEEAEETREPVKVRPTTSETQVPFSDSPPKEVSSRTDAVTTSTERRVSFPDISFKEVSSSDDGDTTTTKRRVSFPDIPLQEVSSRDDADDMDSNNEPLVITFKHSSDSHSHNSQTASVQSIQSPADIYACYNYQSSPKGLKSILKNKSSDPRFVSNIEPDSTSVLVPEEPTTPDYEHEAVSLPPPVTSEVLEHNPEAVEPTEPASRRPMSRFRAARQGGKRF